MALRARVEELEAERDEAAIDARVVLVSQLHQTTIERDEARKRVKELEAKVAKPFVFPNTPLTLGTLDMLKQDLVERQRDRIREFEVERDIAQAEVKELKVVVDKLQRKLQQWKTAFSFVDLD